MDAAPPSDPLTGLPTRAAFVDAVLAAVQAGAEPTLLQVGLDRFREVNEHLGFPAGDAVLVEVAHRLRRAAGPDAQVARLGGDEFGVLVDEHVDRAGVETLARRVLHATSQPCRVPDDEAGAVVDVTVGASVGLVRPGGEAGDRRLGRLLTAADDAMRQAKARGRGRYQWWAPPTATAGSTGRAGQREELQLERRLRSALARREITLHYQPLVDLPHGRVVGVEALARWEDAELGTVRPDRFVAVAERGGLIFDLGQQVLQRACTEGARWATRTGRPSLAVGVNVSPLQLVDRDLVRDVARVLEWSGMPPERLCLEITETAAVEDLDETARRLRELRALGVSIALDDFGTGYSSLTMLRRLPVDLVKMDRSFVAHLTSDAHDAVLARLMIDAAHAMGMQVCAEGVETQEQARQLAALGCDRAQGWHFAAAQPPGPALDAMLRRDLGAAPPTPHGTAPALAGTDELVLVTDPRGVVAFASSSAVQLLGTPPSDLVGTHVLEHVRPAPGASVTGPDGGLPEGIARVQATAGGGGRWLEVRTSTVPERDGRPRQTLSLARDVTAVVAAEEETAESERRFRHAFDDAPIGMAMTTLDGRFIRVNRAYATMLGHRPEDLMRMTVDELTVEEDRAADHANLDRARRGEEQVHDVVKHYVHRDRHPVPARVRASVVTAQDGAPAYILAHVVTYSGDGAAPAPEV